jgi:hypothetical protein
VGRDEPGGRKKYEAPRATQPLVDRLSPQMQAKLTLLVSETVRAEPAGEAHDEFRIMLDFEGRFKRVSEEFCGLVGYEPSPLLGKRIDDITALHTANIPSISEPSLSSATFTVCGCLSIAMGVPFSSCVAG